MEIQQSEFSQDNESRSSIMIIGAPDVGKTSILNKLMQSRRGALKSNGISCHGWTIDNKYYTANVGIWLGRLAYETDNEDLPRLQSLSCHCEALVMVFDLSSDPSFDSLKSWASRMDLSNFEILLCIGNKADKVPDHYGHTEYRRKVQKHGESVGDPHPEFLNFGIQRSEGNSLLNNEDDDESSFPKDDKKRRSRIEWCIENGIEYIEACAADEVFDECLSVDGDQQGVARVRGALSAHMWQGMVMKPEAKLRTTMEPSSSINTDSPDLSSDESDFTFEYELLSDGGFSSDPETYQEQQHEVESIPDAAEPSQQPELAESSNVQVDQVETEPKVEEAIQAAGPGKVDDGSRKNKDEASLEVFEHFMQEMTGMRENLMTMPDPQRREMASQIALRMASMFMDDGDDDE